MQKRKNLQETTLKMDLDKEFISQLENDPKRTVEKSKMFLKILM